jgi:hypothetical protein
MTGAMKPRGVLRQPCAEAVVERQHIVLLGLAPPHPDHLLQPLRLPHREIIDLGKIPIEMKQLPLVVVIRRAGRVIGHRLPTVVPEAAMPEHLEILKGVAANSFFHVNGATSMACRFLRASQRRSGACQKPPSDRPVVSKYGLGIEPGCRRNDASQAYFNR